MGNAKVMIDGELVSVRSEYSSLIDIMTLNRESYDSLGGFLDGSRILRFTRETDAGYASRKARCYYPNISRSLADTLSGHLFKQQITRETSNKVIESFLSHTDALGEQDMTDLIKEAYTQSFVCGYSVIIIDKPSIEFASMRDEIDSGLPYAYVVPAVDVIDWRFDEFGELLWIKIKEKYIDNLDDFTGEQSGELRFRVWTRDEWYLLDAKANIIDSGVHGLGAVPAVWLRNQRSLSYPDIGVTEFTPMVQINFALFNRLSELDAILVNKTFPYLVLPGLDKSSDTDMLTTGSDMVIMVDPESKIEPKFIAPSGDSVESYLTVTKFLIDQMRDIAKQSYTGGANSSGIAKEIEFEKTNQLIKDKADRLRRVELSIIRIFSLWMGIEDSDVNIAYPKDFNLRDLMRELDQIAASAALSISETFDKSLKKRASRVILPTLPQKTQRIIDKEIEGSNEPINTGG